jgi:hypothetical protein
MVARQRCSDVVPKPLTGRVSQANDGLAQPWNNVSRLRSPTEARARIRSRRPGAGACLLPCRGYPPGKGHERHPSPLVAARSSSHRRVDHGRGHGDVGRRHAARHEDDQSEHADLRDRHRSGSARAAVPTRQRASAAAQRRAPQGARTGQLASSSAPARTSYSRADLRTPPVPRVLASDLLAMRPAR